MNDNPNSFGSKLELIKASDIKPKQVRWLWYPYIPFGKVTLLQGDPGDGKSKERLANIQERVEAAQTKYEAAWNVRKTESEIDDMGKKTITGKYTVSKEDYKQLTALAKEGITSRQEIHKLNEDISLYKKQYIDCKYELRDTQSAYAALRRRCEPFLQALKYFPQFAKGFAEKISDLLEHREAQQKKEREEAKRNPHRASARRQDDQDLER